MAVGGSVLSWLDVSSDQQRRVRDMIRLFEEPGTRDELGLGPIRDSFSDLLFPGTSTLQTRVRYFVFIPWLFQAAAARGRRGQALLDTVERSERQLIERFKSNGHVDGLIGRLAGARVKYLPSTLYWSGLDRWGVLTASMSPRAVAELSSSRSDIDVDELDDRTVGPWHPTLPHAPAGFPNGECGGFDLTSEEANWLQERILDRTPGTLLAHLVTQSELLAEGDLWAEPTIADADAQIRSVVEHGRRFSLLMHGPALLYNLLVAERYERKGFTRVDEPIDRYREALADWAARFDAEIGPDWNWPEFWTTVQLSRHRIAPGAKDFTESWAQRVASAGADSLADDHLARAQVEARVSKLRGRRAVIGNDKLLAQWGGSSGSAALNYRWGTVSQLITDVHEGRDRAGA